MPWSETTASRWAKALLARGGDKLVLPVDTVVTGRLDFGARRVWTLKTVRWDVADERLLADEDVEVVVLGRLSRDLDPLGPRRRERVETMHVDGFGQPVSAHQIQDEELRGEDT
jgi:hypothetical protein